MPSNQVYVGVQSAGKMRGSPGAQREAQMGRLSALVKGLVPYRTKDTAVVMVDYLWKGL